MKTLTTLRNIALITLAIGLISFGLISCGNDFNDMMKESEIPTPTYTVSFNGNGAASAPAPISGITSSETINTPADPVWTDNVFDGWHDSALTTKYNFPLTITSNITLYAKWQYTAKQVWDYQDFGSYAPTFTEFNISSKNDFANAKSAIEAAGGGNYILNITSNVDIGGAGINLAANAKVSLRGGGTIHKTARAGLESLFDLVNTNSKLILRDAVLQGYTPSSGDNYSLVYVGSSAAFDMKGGTISGNSSKGGGGGGGVHVYGGSFTMTGGTISGNTADYGGGVFVRNGGSFTMSGGTISDNNASSSGGVHVSNSSFTKTGGTIYGKDGSANQNVATNGDTYGHAVYFNDSMTSYYRSTTLGESDNISTATADRTNPPWSW